VPHPTTLMKLTTRCGSAAVDALNAALLAKAAEAKLPRTGRLRADTTVVSANARPAGTRADAIAAKLGLRGAQRREEAQATVARVTGELAGHSAT
jgi:transposase, IS5 family